MRVKLRLLICLFVLAIYAQLYSYSNRAINPLIPATWHQDDPWNARCPGEGQNRANAGSHALALAKLMKYWEYPANGTGNVSYYDDNFGQISQDFTSDILWSNMSNTLVFSTTQRFIFMCGASVNTDYEYQNSSSTLNSIQTSLVTYFHYDPGIQTYTKDEFSDSSWSEMIHTELSLNRPIIYSITLSSGREVAFIIDGENDSGQFHINWSSNSISDSWEYLNDLTYLGETISDVNQSMLLGIKPFSVDAPLLSISMAGDSSVLSWQACVGATSYKIEYAYDPYGTYTMLTTTSALSYTHTGIGNSQSKMFYRVIAQSGRVESAPSAVVGYVKYACVPGLNMIALPLETSMGWVHELGSEYASSIESIYYWNAAAQTWVGSTDLGGCWDGDFPIHTNDVLFVSNTSAMSMYICGHLPAAPAQYSLVQYKLNAILVPLNRADLTWAMQLGWDTDSEYVYKWDNTSHSFFTAFRWEDDFWDGDFPIEIGDPLLIYPLSSLTWPSRSMDAVQTKQVR